MHDKGKITKMCDCNYEVATSCSIFHFIIDTVIQISDVLDWKYTSKH